MERQCYYNIVDKNDLNVKQNVPFMDNWKIYEKLSDNLYIMYQTKKGINYYSSLYIYTFSLNEKTNSQDIDTYNLKSISDKLRFYRHNAGLSQEDVANYLEISRVTYCSYENGVSNYSFKILLRLAERYNIDVDVLLDDYHKFIYNEQGQHIKAIRKELNLKQYELANILNISDNILKRCERDKARLSRKNYDKLMNYYYNCLERF